MATVVMMLVAKCRVVLAERGTERMAVPRLRLTN